MGRLFVIGSASTKTRQPVAAERRASLSLLCGNHLERRCLWVGPVRSGCASSAAFCSEGAPATNAKPRQRWCSRDGRDQPVRVTGAKPGRTGSKRAGDRSDGYLSRCFLLFLCRSMRIQAATMKIAMLISSRGVSLKKKLFMPSTTSAHFSFDTFTDISFSNMLLSLCSGVQVGEGETKRCCYRHPQNCRSYEGAS